jgi:hypothetical protein
MTINDRRNFDLDQQAESAAARGEYRQAAGAVAEGLMRTLAYAAMVRGA